MKIEDVTNYMSQKLIESKSKYRIIKLTPESKLFFNLIQKCDIKGLLQLFQDKSFNQSLINSCVEKGFYPIHIAIKKYNVQLLEPLLKYGAKLHVTTRNGKTVKETYQIYENQEIIDILQRYHYFK